MLDKPTSSPTILDILRNKLGAQAPTLPGIFQTGDAIEEASEDITLLPSGTPTQRIAVLGDVTIDYLRRAVGCAVLQENVFPVLYQAPYGAYVQEVLDPCSAMNAFGPELIVIAPHWRYMVAPLPIALDARNVEAALEVKVELFRNIWQKLAAQGIKIIQHTLIAPQMLYCGIAERLAPAAAMNQIRWLNEKLLDAGRGLVTWVDMEALSNEIGWRKFSPPKFYYSAKLDHDQKFLPDYLPCFRAAWRSANARTKKVLVLDLDNTLWGGVIGDDGVDGIVLGDATPAGEAFEAWQHYIKALGERGVILAVCSKNDPSIAEAGFNHPSGVLKLSDFAAFECSWNDKVAGLRRIAQDLNVGIDSFVFCDDNPAECDLIRQALPEVAVVHMGADPAAFINLLDAGHWLDMQAYTQEDLGRAAAYGARAAALAEQSQATDIGGYLAGLGMTGRLYRPDEADLGRIVQMELKTNQFNVTTRRYSEAQIRAFVARKDAVVLAFRLVDKFGDHGLTSTLIGFHEDDILRIDSWLMSCRIFSRSAEQFILRGLIRLCEGVGVTRLSGEYLPTSKNAVVADLYPRMGFTMERAGLFVRDLQAGLDDLTSYVSEG